MKRLWRRIVDAYRTELYPPKKTRRQYLTDAERNAIMLTAEGNVYLAMGALCTSEEVADIKREVLNYVDSHPAY